MPGFEHLLEDAIGWISVDGALTPRNQAMHRLCETDQETVSQGVERLFSGEVRAEVEEYLASAAGEVRIADALQRSERYYDARLHREADGHWLILEDVTREREWRQAALRLGRVRLIGQLGEGVIHDLNNVLGSIVGMADHLLEAETDPKAQEFLRSVVDGTKDRSGLLKSLYRFLSNSRGERQLIPPEELAGDIELFFGKSALHAGVPFEIDVEDGLPAVKAVREDVLQALLAILVRDLETRAGPIELRMREVTTEPESGVVPRRYVAIRIVDRGEIDPVARLFGKPSGERSFALDAATQNLQRPAVALACRGAYFDVGEENGVRWVQLCLPAARRRAVGAS